MGLAGCGGDGDLPPNYKTTVEVVYKGAPVDGALVTLRPDGHEAPTATGVTGPDGKVEMYSYQGKGQGVVPGKYLVGIEKTKVELAPALSTDDPDYGKAIPDEETRKPRADLLPAKYISAATSGLTCDVTDDPAKNVIKFELVD